MHNHFIPSLSRRALLGGLAVLALPFPRAFAQEPEVVIIGAGAAGLAAARTLIDKGRSVVVIEARDRIGGRAWTDSATFSGIPFDHGCSWLHSSNENPWTPIAKNWKYNLLSHDEAEETVFVGNRHASDSELEDYGRAWDKLNGAIAAAGRAGKDVSAASVSPRDESWIWVAESWIGPMSMGKDLEDFSCQDWWNLKAEEPNLMIQWGGPGVAVETDAGTIRARICIVTVPLGVLAAETIAFDPPLPGWKKEAIAGLPMGLLAKAPLQFDGTSFGLAENSWLTYKAGSTESCFFLARPFGFDLMIGFLGGKCAWELTREGDAAAVDFAKEKLRDMLGSETDKHFVRGGFTGWGRDPWSLGAYASAKPGAYAARAAMRKPVEDRLFFAGEACAGAFAETCGGAMRSGIENANEVEKLLG
jgi:monoamine oxidase